MNLRTPGHSRCPELPTLAAGRWRSGRPMAFLRTTYRQRFVLLLHGHLSGDHPKEIPGRMGQQRWSSHPALACRPWRRAGSSSAPDRWVCRGNFCQGRAGIQAPMEGHGGVLSVGKIAGDPRRNASCFGRAILPRHPCTSEKPKGQIGGK